MKSLGADLLSEQSQLNRKPQSRIIFRDVMLRMDADWVTNAYAPGFPGYNDADNIPQHPYDSYVTGATATPINRAWCVDADTIRTGYINDPAQQYHWISSLYGRCTEIGSVNHDFPTPDGIHRLSVSWSSVYYGSSGDIVKAGSGSTVWSYFKQGAYSCDTSNIALAAIENNTVYMATLNIEGMFKYISLYRVDESGSTNECPHTIPVDADFNSSSLQWFDAERISGTDVIITNTRTYGYPIVTRYSNGVWSTPQPLMQMDELSSTSYLRIGSVTNIEDSNGDEVLWATGTLSRGGSTGNYPAAYDLCMRSKDGDHWTVDRYSYICEDAICGKLLPYGSYVYYERGRTVMRASRTWLMGYDNPDLKLEIEDDIQAWKLNIPNAGAAVSGTTTLADAYATYNKSTELLETAPGRWNAVGGTLAITPGMWMFRYAGYNGHDAIMSVEAVDQCPGSYQVGQRKFDIRSRGIVMRSLYDWSSDQNWQLLSQVKHYDDCDQMSHLYSISSAQIEVESDEDAEVTGNVDEEEIDEETGDLIFDSPNRVSINLCTKPAQTANFQVAVRFSIDDDNGSTTGLSTGYVESTFVVDSGTGGSYQTDGDGYPYFEHAGQDFSDWAALTTSQISTIRDFEDELGFTPTNARYAIAVTNTDGTITYGYLGCQTGLSSHQIEILNTGISGALRGNTINAWCGAGTSGKTPESYVVFRSDSWARIGTGAGVVGCVSDQYNLIAAVPDMVADKLYLLIRRGDEDEAIWIPWKSASTAFSTKTRYYEVLMIRNGKNVKVKMYDYLQGTANRTEIASIDEDWPLAEPMVVVDDEAYNQTDRGKVGVICYISTPETQLGTCQSDREWVPRNPSLFVKTLTISEENFLEDVYTTWEDFTNGYTWNGSSWVQKNNVDIPPFHFGGETYDPVEDDPSYGSSDYWGDQWMVENASGELPVVATVGRLRRVKITPTDYGLPYNSCAYEGGSWEDMPNHANYYQFAFGPDHKTWYREGTTYTEEDTCPIYIIGNPPDSSENDYQGAVSSFSEIAIHVDARDDEDWYVLNDMGYTRREMLKSVMRRGGGEVSPGSDAASPDVTAYPGFYLPGRAMPNEPETAHARGTVIRQHWNPKITLRGVWAYDDTTDKTLEWTMKDIAYKAGVIDFDTEYSVDESIGVWGFTPETAWLRDTLEQSVYQKDFDITVQMTTKVPTHSNQYLALVARASSKKTGALLGATANLTDFSALLIRVGMDYYENAHIILDQTSADTSGWVRVGDMSVPGGVIGKKVRFVGREEFVSVYIEDMYVGTMATGEIYGSDSDGYAAPAAGYMGVYKGFAPAGSVTQPELWAWTDAIILDSRQNAISGLQHCLRDRRIRFVETCAQTGQPSLRMSNLSLRYTTTNISDYSHWIGTVTDHQSGDADYPSGSSHVSIFSDTTGETDRIPTHVRVVGYEIGDRIDHTSAAKYGILFQSHQCPNLEEAEAYNEAGRIVRDALSHSGSRKPTAAAQIQWEIEDALLLDYTPHDQGPDVSSYFIVDSMSLQYTAEPRLEVSANLREMP